MNQIKKTCYFLITTGNIPFGPEFSLVWIANYIIETSFVNVCSKHLLWTFAASNLKGYSMRNALLFSKFNALLGISVFVFDIFPNWYPLSIEIGHF